MVINLHIPFKVDRQSVKLSNCYLFKDSFVKLNKSKFMVYFSILSVAQAIYMASNNRMTDKLERLVTA
jgi:hypothetical protein